MRTPEPGGIPSVAADRLAWLTEEQMREVDRVMIEEVGISLLQMMENAGRNLADLVIRRFAPRTAIVLAGVGGNGGGGMVAARHLHDRGVDARVVLADPDRIGEVPALQRGILERIGVPIRDEPSPADVVVDSLLGYSGRGAPRGRTAELIRWANDSPAPRCALDLPSGLDATSGDLREPWIRATATLTLAMPKTGLRRGSVAAGELFLADIAVPPEVIARIAAPVETPFKQATIVRVR